MTVEMLGPDKGQQKEVRALNRAIRWNQDKGTEYEADPWHLEVMVSQLELENAKSVAAHGAKEEGRTNENHDEELNEDKPHQCRALVA